MQKDYKLQLTESSCVGEVLQLYQDECTIYKKLIVTFKGEQVVDGGGLTKELFNVFFSQITDLYFRGEDCLVPFLQPSEIHKQGDYVLIERVLMHMMLLTGTAPSKISRVALMFIANRNDEIKGYIAYSILLTCRKLQ